MPPKKGGRPPKYVNDNECKAARAAASRRSYTAQRERETGRGAVAIGPPALDIRPDPYSLLMQTGLEEGGRITSLAAGIQADDLDIPTDPQLVVFPSIQDMSILLRVLGRGKLRRYNAGAATEVVLKMRGARVVVIHA